MTSRRSPHLRALALAAGFVAASNGPLGAQSAVPNTPTATATAAAGAAGKWLVRFDYQGHAMHGKPAPVETIEAQLTLHMNRDSISGEWQRLSSPGEPPLTPYVVQGVQRGDSVFLRLVPIEDKDEGMISNALHDMAVFFRTYFHGMPPTTTAIAAAIRGDVISGTRQQVLLDGTPNGRTEVLSGARAKP